MSKYTIDTDIFIQPLNNVHMKDLDTVVTNDRVYDLIVDLSEYNTSPKPTNIKFIKGDVNTSIIKVKMVMGGKTIRLDDTTITMNLKEGNKPTITTLCENIDVTTGTVTINLDSYNVDEPGLNVFEFILNKSGNISVSSSYSYTVIDSIGEGEIGTPEELTVLQQMINKTQGIINEMKVDMTLDDIDDIIDMVENSNII